MKTFALVMVVLLLASSLASAEVKTFDTLGFEGYTLGDMTGQDGWYVELDGGTATIVDNSADPTEGTKALKLTAPSSVDDPVNVGQLLGDYAFISHDVSTDPLKWAKVSFDIWREPGTVTISDSIYDKANMNRLHWWTASTYTSIIGAQFDDNTTYPFLMGLGATNSATTVTGSFANLTVSYDFEAKTRSSWYNGVLVDDAIPIDDDGMTGFKDIEIYYEQVSPTYQAGTFGYAAYIDNLHVEYETNPIPAAGPLLVCVC